jgi:hypothetical protein
VEAFEERNPFGALRDYGGETVALFEDEGGGFGVGEDGGHVGFILRLGCVRRLSNFRRQQR